MKKIFNYILIACFLLSAVACNAQHQKMEDGIKRDSTKSWRQLYTNTSHVDESYRVLKASEIRPLVKHNYGPDDVRDVAEKMPHPQGGFTE